TRTYQFTGLTGLTWNFPTWSSRPLPSGMFSVALSVPYEPPSYEAHCPVEFGLSSRSSPRDHPSACHIKILCPSATCAIHLEGGSGILGALPSLDARNATTSRAGSIDAIPHTASRIPCSCAPRTHRRPQPDSRWHLNGPVFGASFRFLFPVPAAK